MVQLSYISHRESSLDSSDKRLLIVEPRDRANRLGLRVRLYRLLTLTYTIYVCHRYLIYTVNQFAHSTTGHTVFTALHGMQRGLNDEISVRLSVRPSVRPSVCLSNACIVTKRKKDMF